MGLVSTSTPSRSRCTGATDNCTTWVVAALALLSTPWPTPLTVRLAESSRSTVDPSTRFSASLACCRLIRLEAVLSRLPNNWPLPGAVEREIVMVLVLTSSPSKFRSRGLSVSVASGWLVAVAREEVLLAVMPPATLDGMRPALAVWTSPTWGGDATFRMGLRKLLLEERRVRSSRASNGARARHRAGRRMAGRTRRVNHFMEHLLARIRDTRQPPQRADRFTCEEATEHLTASSRSAKFVPEVRSTVEVAVQAGVDRER